jgi:transposase
LGTVPGAVDPGITERAQRPRGRPPFDYVMMFKILVLQRLYNISDAQAEYQIKDRLSFMRFPGLALCGTIPDGKTIWEYREHVAGAKILVP